MEKNIGLMIVGTLIFYLLSVLLPQVLIVPTGLSWMVPLLMWRTLGKGAVRQTSLLLFIGTVAHIFSASHGVFLGWKQILAANLPLLAMFIGVTFLSLTNKGFDDPTLPTGNRAIVTTALGIHLLGAAINLSAVLVFGDRLQKKGILSRDQITLLARSFSAAAWWSPFFIATGVALTYAPGMDWKQTLLPGAVMSFISIGYSIVEICFFRTTEFSGYPLKAESLKVPAFLTATVLSVHHFWHDVNILLLICVISPVGAFIFMQGRPRLATLSDFVKNRTMSVISQFALFLSAGVFSTGLKSITHVYPELFRLEGLTLSPLLFAIVLAAMVFIGILGVHPIVSIAIVSPLLMPLNPDQSQLGFLFLSCWAISTGSSPLSGVGLVFVSRYKAPVREILKGSWHYAFVMWLIASVVNVLIFTG
ncbi:MAG: hypothetical protein ACN4GW_06490 [Desulforhopalus sp.]